jgi:DNA-binding transcriptional regulator YhcF (GntR family)
MILYRYLCRHSQRPAALPGVVQHTSPAMPAASLTRHAGQTLAGQLADRFAESIRSRLLAPGARLPSVRECARQYGVSPHTVVAAYDQLQGQGLLEVRRQRGFFVRDGAAAQSTRAAICTGCSQSPCWSR